MLTKNVEQIQSIRLQAAQETIDYLKANTEPNKVLQYIGMAPVLPLLSQGFSEVASLGGPVVKSGINQHIVKYDSPHGERKIVMAGSLSTPHLSSAAPPSTPATIHDTQGGPTLRVDNVHYDLSEDDLRVRTFSALLSFFLHTDTLYRKLSRKKDQSPAFTLALKAPSSSATLTRPMRALPNLTTTARACMASPFKSRSSRHQLVQLRHLSVEPINLMPCTLTRSKIPHSRPRRRVVLLAHAARIASRRG